MKLTAAHKLHKEVLKGISEEHADKIIKTEISNSMAERIYKDFIEGKDLIIDEDRDSKTYKFQLHVLSQEDFSELMRLLKNMYTCNPKFEIFLKKFEEVLKGEYSPERL
jgi:hypothetical protein